MDSDMDTDIPVHIQTNRVINIATEKQLHNQVVSWIRRFHPELVIVPGLGELQKTDEARMEAWAKGYTKGQADLLILHNNVDFAGMRFEFKSPLGSGTLSDTQEEFLFKMKKSGYYVMVSNDYDEIIDTIVRYLANR
jgi:hypothetical protein